MPRRHACSMPTPTPLRSNAGSYEMHIDQARISVSLATTELRSERTGTRLIYTEQGAYLDGLDKPARS